MDEEILSFQKLNSIDGGSTAVVVIKREYKLYVANCGDSSAVIISKNNCQKINRDHNTDNEEEIKTLEKRNAIILEYKKKLRINGELLVTRSFGDRKYKEFITAEPEIATIDLKECSEFEYIALASDGFWNVNYC